MSELINFASLKRGACAYNDSDYVDHRREAPLTENHDDNIYTATPPSNLYTIELVQPELINCLVIRLHYSDKRSYIFSQFETSADGNNWTTLLPAGTIRKQSFKELFPARLIQFFRMRATNTVNNYLHLIRFQAFYIEPQDFQIPEATAVLAQSNNIPDSISSPYAPPSSKE